MKRGAGIAVMALVLSGCGPTLWTKPGASTQDFNVDSYNCEKDVRQSGYYGTGIAGAVNVQGFFGRCMVAHGWTEQGSTPAAAPAYVPVRDVGTGPMGTCQIASGIKIMERKSKCEARDGATWSDQAN